MSVQEIADSLRKAASGIAPFKIESKGSRRFPITAGREIYEHFDKQFKDMINNLKKDIERILS